MRAPAYIEPVLHAAFGLLELGAIDGVDDHALAGHHDTHDAVAREWMAALAQGVGDSFCEALDRYGLALLARCARRNLPVRVMLQFREHGLQHLVGAQLATANLRQQILRLVQAQLFGDLLNRLVGQLAMLIGKGLLQDLAPELDVLVALRVAQEAADLEARTAGDDELLPQG